MRLPFRVFLIIFEMEYIIETICVPWKDSGVYAINSDRVFGSSSDRAAHKATIDFHVVQVVPKLLRILIEHSTSVVKMPLLTDHCCHVCEAIINEAWNQRLIAAMELSVGLLDQWDPEFVRWRTLSEHKLLIALINWKAVIDDHVTPLVIFREAEHINALMTELMEDGWIDTHRE